MLFSEDYGDQQARFDALDLRVMVRMRDIELLDESHQERLHLYDATTKQVFSVPGESKRYERRSTHANRHPMQLLTPPENVELGG